MSDFTFLTEEQLVGKNKLDILKIRGIKAVKTDFSILLGGRDHYYWTKSKDVKEQIRNIVSENGDIYSVGAIERRIGARVALTLSSISDIPRDKVSLKKTIDGVYEIEYGFYPQKAVPKNMQEELEQVYKNGKIGESTCGYTVCSYAEAFHHQKRRYVEYNYNGKRYVRAEQTYYNEIVPFELSNGEKYSGKDNIWIEVLPVKWLVDEKAKIMLTEKIIFSGVPFCNGGYFTPLDFNNKFIKRFIDNHFAKDLLQHYNLESSKDISGEALEIDRKMVANEIEDKLQNVSVKKENPYNFNFDKVSEEDIIKGALESDVAVFLHGRSSEGKSARVKQLDPDPEIVYLRNATPESLNGKSVYNAQTGEMIDIKPTWLQKLESKCRKEKDKIHIVFLDEITNALPSIQGMAFNIVLDREVNGKWKLPENSRIVAAGNDLEDSLAANELAEPLFNRFAHVYINTTAESWLEWAARPQESYERIDYRKVKQEAKIHPSIYAYIAYKSYKGEEALRTKYNGKKPNADPRKWEMASKMLYATGNPEMLRGLIGEDLTKDFTEFCKKQTISVDDVVNKRYSKADLKMDISEKYMTAVGLSSVGEEDLEIVRDFVLQMGPEILSTFDNIWVHGDEKRLEKIAELRQEDKEKVISSLEEDMEKEEEPVSNEKRKYFGYTEEEVLKDFYKLSEIMIDGERY